MKGTGFGPLQMALPRNLMALSDEEKEKWTEVFKGSGWILERVRAQCIHKANKFIVSPRVLIGDSTAMQLKTAMERTEVIGQEGTISSIIRAFSATVLSSKVQGVLVMLGRDSIMAGETVDTIMSQFQRLRALLEQYEQLAIFWTPPPYIHAKGAEHTELVRRLAQLLIGTNVHFVAATESGRSLLEVYRFGSSFNPSMVNAAGMLTDQGLRAVCAWIYTQVAGFPGDRTIGIRTLHSRVVVPERSRPQNNSNHRISHDNHIHSRSGRPPSTALFDGPKRLFPGRESGRLHPAAIILFA